MPVEPSMSSGMPPKKMSHRMDSASPAVIWFRARLNSSVLRRKFFGEARKKGRQSIAKNMLVMARDIANSLKRRVMSSVTAKAARMKSEPRMEVNRARLRSRDHATSWLVFFSFCHLTRR